MSASAADSFRCTPHTAGVSAQACVSGCPGTCHGSGRIWVVAACGGHMALYEKWPKVSGAELIPLGQDIVPASLEKLISLLKSSHARKQFEQLLIVGNQNDLSWIQSLLPEEVANCVVAEIHYPLLEGWFHEVPHLKALSGALSTLLQN